jgi:hypothetical protein
MALGNLNFQAPAKLDTVNTTKELGYLALVACDTELNRLKELKQTETERTARMSGQVQGSSSNGGGGESFGAPDPMGGDAAFAPPMPGTGSNSTPPGYAPPGGGAAGGFGGSMGAVATTDPKGYRFDVVRRRIRQQLYCVQFGITGGEDFNPSKPPVGAVSSIVEAKLPARGMNAFAKPGDEKKYVSEVYDKVRKLADICENKAVDMATLEKELRRNMKPLEAITKKLSPAAPGTGPAADVPGAPVAARGAAAAASVSKPPAPPAPSPPDAPAGGVPPANAGAAPAPPANGAAPAAPAGETAPPAAAPPAASPPAAPPATPAAP